jgi:hypothetical protein
MGCTNDFPLFREVEPAVLKQLYIGKVFVLLAFGGSCG